MGFTAAVTAGAEFLGADAATAATIGEVGADIATGAVVGGGIGGVESAATGGNIGQGILHGAEAGGLTGGGIGAAGASGLNAAIGATAGDAIGGAAGGALGAEVTGGNPLLGAAEGGVAGGITGYNSTGAGVNSSGTTVAAPSSSTSVAPSSGGGFTPAAEAIDLGANQENTLFDNSVTSGAQTTGATGTGSVAPSAAGASPVGANPAINAQPSGPMGEINQPSLMQQATAAYNGTDSLAQVNGIDQGPNQFANASGDSVSSNSPSVASFGTPQANGGLNPMGAPATGGGSGGGSVGTGSSLLSKAENVGIQAALPLGALAYDAIKGPAALPAASGALQPGGAATSPLLALENQGATEATTGQLTPTQQAGITQYVNNAQNQLIQQLASEGVTDPTHDSRYIQGMQQIQQQALVQQQQYITAAIAEATSAGGAASTNITNVANQQIAQDTSFQDSLAAAFAALGGVSVGGIVNNRPAA